MSDDRKAHLGFWDAYSPFLKRQQQLNEFAPPPKKKADTEMEEDHLKELNKDLARLSFNAEVAYRRTLGSLNKTQILTAWSGKSYQLKTADDVEKLQGRIQAQIQNWKDVKAGKRDTAGKKMKLQNLSKGEFESKTLVKDSKIDKLYEKSVASRNERDHMYIKSFHRMNEVIELYKLRNDLRNGKVDAATFAQKDKELHISEKMEARKAAIKREIIARIPRPYLGLFGAKKIPPDINEQVERIYEQELFPERFRKPPSSDKLDVQTSTFDPQRDYEKILAKLYGQIAEAGAYLLPDLAPEEKHARTVSLDSKRTMG